MWSRKKKRWQKYNEYILAADMHNAMILSSYLREVAMLRMHLYHLEVIDLQKYEIVRKAVKMQAALYKADRTPFVFVVGTN